MAASRQPVIDFVSLPLNFFARPAQIVGPDLVGCRLVKRQADGGLLWGVIVETEAYSQDDPACHGYRRRSPQNETLFGEPGRFYVYVSYGIHHCVTWSPIGPIGPTACCCVPWHFPMNRSGLLQGPACWHDVSGLIAVMTAVR